MPKGGGITQLGANPFDNAPGFSVGGGQSEPGEIGNSGNDPDNDGGTTGGNAQGNSGVNGEIEATDPNAEHTVIDHITDWYDNAVLNSYAPSTTPNADNTIGTTGGENGSYLDNVMNPPEEEEGMPARWETRQPREFGSSDFYAQYPTSSPTFGDLLTRHEETPESDSFNYGGVVYNYDAARNVFTDRYSGREISATNGATGSLGIDGLYG